jgi:hypothetical protein
VRLTWFKAPFVFGEVAVAVVMVKYAFTYSDEPYVEIGALFVASAALWCAIVILADKRFV